MSDRIIRASAVRHVRAWEPARLQTAAVQADQPDSIPTEDDIDRADALPTLAIGDNMQASLERIRSRAFEEGVQQGFQQGVQHAVQQAEHRAAQQQQARQEFNQSIESLNAILGFIQQASDALDAECSQLQRALPAWISDMALAVAKQVIGHSVQHDAQAVASHVMAALETIAEPLRTRAEIRLHPDTRKQLESLHLQSFRVLSDRLCDDSDMVPGGFVIRTAAGEIDHRIETRWQRVVETFCADAANRTWIRK